MNEITTTKTSLPAAMDDIFNPAMIDDLIEGASSGFGVISFRGGKWRVKHGGEETLITNADDEPVASIPVVIVKASRQVSKIYYERNYEEGDDNPPDCFSIDGVTPDASAPDKQANECATCPMNQWGSRVTEAGKKAKRCSDHRRLAVVPAARKGEDADTAVLRNEVYGGPMLMRVPPASLNDMAVFARDLRKRYPELGYNSIVTLIGFDPKTAYPKLTFKALRRIKEDEKQVIYEMSTDGSVDNVLSSTTEVVTVAEKPKVQKTVDVELEEDDIDGAVADAAKHRDEELAKAAADAVAAQKKADAAKAKDEVLEAAAKVAATKGNGAAKNGGKKAVQATSGNAALDEAMGGLMDGALDDLVGELNAEDGDDLDALG